MQQIKQVIILMTLVVITACGDKQPKDLIKENSSLFTDLKGNNISLSDYKGKRILVNYWATWCTPCLQEMPTLVHAQEILQNENYVFLFPTTDAINKIKAFQKVKKYPLQFIHYTATLDKIEIYALPATFIYNTKGTMVKRIDGATAWDDEEMLNLLKLIE